MILHIEIKKEHTKPSILKCTRVDGSFTFAKLYPNLEVHDIAHYVVETQLNFSNAFYGLLAIGHNISDFQIAKEKRPEALQPKNLHSEALMTEHIVNILQTMYEQKEYKAEFLQIIKTILKEKQLPLPDLLSPQRLKEMYNQLDDLMHQWLELPNHQKLRLKFECQ